MFSQFRMLYLGVWYEPSARKRVFTGSNIPCGHMYFFFKHQKKRVHKLMKPKETTEVTGHRAKHLTQSSWNANLLGRPSSLSFIHCHSFFKVSRAHHEQIELALHSFYFFYSKCLVPKKSAL